MEYKAAMIIRLASVNDAAAIAEIALSLGYKMEAQQSLTENALGYLLDAQYDRVWVAELNGTVIGWLHAQHAFRMASVDFIEILGLSVSEQSRFQGAGRALVERVKAWASEEHVSLRVRTNDIRYDAKKFYSALGFSLVKTQSVFQISF